MMDNKKIYRLDAHESVPLTILRSSLLLEDIVKSENSYLPSAEDPVAVKGGMGSQQRY
jgi:hypothetical protein